MNILPLQKEMIKADKSIVICANVSGTGHTIGLMLKIVELYYQYTHECRNDLEVVTVLSPSWRFNSWSVEKLIDICEEFKIDYEYSRTHESIFLGDNNFKVFFETDIDSVRHLKRDYLMVEQAHLFVEDDLRELIVRDYKQIYFTTNPYECGWRNPKFEHGEVVYSSKGDMVCVSESWDSIFIDWDKTSTRAKPSDYKDNVQVITGYGWEDNILVGDNFKYEMSRLDPLTKYRLDGMWKEGHKL